jgi:hypothetical protein
MLRRRRARILALAAVLAAAPAAAPAAPPDFARARRDADAVAARSDPGAKLWRVDANVVRGDAGLAVLDYLFHYVYRHPQGLGVLTVAWTPHEVEGPSHGGRGGGRLGWIEDWQVASPPAHLAPAGAVLRALGRELPPAAVPAPRSRGRRRGDGPPGGPLFALRLVQAGAALSREREHAQWMSLGRSLGLGPGDVRFFAATAPAGRWIWWTAVELDRPDPGTDPRRAGTPARVFQYIYIDALDGAARSHCLGPVSGEVPCAGAAPAVPPMRPAAALPAPGPAAPAASRRAPVDAREVLVTTGRVVDASGGQVVVVTDPDAPSAPPGGTELRFLVNLPELRRLGLRPGERVTVRYQRRGGQLLATDIERR